MATISFSNRMRTGKDYILKHKILSVFTIILLASIPSYFLFFKKTAITTILQDVKVVRKTISVNVSGTGMISPTNTVSLKAKGSGDITKISIKAGDTARQGTSLISLDATIAYQKVQTAKVNLETAQLDLEKIQKPADNLAVLQLKNQIASAQQKIKDQDVAVANAYTSLLNVSFEAIPETQTTSSPAPTISGSYLGTTQGQIKITPYMAGDGLRYTITGLVTGDGLASVTTSQPLGTTGLYIKFASTDAQPNWIINIPNTKASGYLNAYTSYQNALTTKQKTIDDTNRTLAELQAQLDKLQAGADSLDIRAKQLAIAQRQNELTQANSDLANYTVAAPFDGIIASVTAEVGDSVGPSTALGTIITNKKIAEISLNEVDIAKVAVGQKATLTFDAINGLKVDGTIAEIDTLGTTSQGVVTYKVKITFDDKDKSIKPGMTVTANIELDKKDNVLVLPNQAIKTVKGKKYVEVRDGQANSTTATKQIEVTTGISNDTESEITSGLDENSSVIIRRKVTTTSTTAAPSLIGGGTGAGGQRTNAIPRGGF